MDHQRQSPVGRGVRGYPSLEMGFPAFLGQVRVLLCLIVFFFNLGGSTEPPESP